MSKGIYGYWDNKLNYVVYIGQTGDLEERRKKHLYPAKHNKINNVLIFPNEKLHIEVNI